MEILVCVTRVPDTSENEIELNSAGTSITGTIWSIRSTNGTTMPSRRPFKSRTRWVENITVVTVGDEEDEEVLRGRWPSPQRALLLADAAFAGLDGKGIAAILKGAVEKGNYDLILTGAQADAGAAQVGGMLAAMLDVPFASLVNAIEVIGGQAQGGP